MGMKNSILWFYVFLAVLIALIANSLSAVWAKGEERLSVWFFALLFFSPLVFISFGLVTQRVGLAISSGVIDSLLTISTIIVALVIFGEWNKISALQYLGVILAISGIILMLFFSKSGS